VTIREPYDKTITDGLTPVSQLPLRRLARQTESRPATFQCRDTGDDGMYDSKAPCKCPRHVAAFPGVPDIVSSVRMLR